MQQADSKWLEKMGWSKNPFALEIHPDLFVGCIETVSAIERGISAGQKYSVIIGPTGSGKTTFLRRISLAHTSYYLPKPPTTKAELLDIFSALFFGTGFARKLFGPKNVTLYNFAENANKKYRGNPPLLLVDEAHEAGIEILEWLRSLADQIDGQKVIFAGLPSFKATHLDKLETLSQRVTVSIAMPPLTKDETFELVKKRVESAGGRGIDPFTSDAISAIFSMAGGFPRETIKLCNSMVIAAEARGASIIDASYLDGTETTKFEAEEVMSTLTEKQVHLLELLSRGPLTPTDIVSKANLPEYKTKAHALRGVNNMLRRLETMGLVCRERRGKRYKYSLLPKVKTLLVKA